MAKAATKKANAKTASAKSAPSKNQGSKNQTASKQQIGNQMLAQSHRISMQYIKNLSLENINYLEVFASDQAYAGQNNSEIDVRINEVENSENYFEVELFLHLTAHSDSNADGSVNDEKKIYDLSVTYAALVQLREDLRPEMMQNILFIEVPSMLFPFLREIVCDHVGKAGYPPFYLNAIDFNKLHEYRIGQYLQRKAEEDEK